MTLRGRKIENFDDISVAAWSGGLFICVSSISFQKSSISWPQQPPTERVSDISEKLDFWWSIPQKGTSIGHFGARNGSIPLHYFFYINYQGLLLGLRIFKHQPSHNSANVKLCFLKVAPCATYLQWLCSAVLQFPERCHGCCSLYDKWLIPFASIYGKASLGLLYLAGWVQ